MISRVRSSVPSPLRSKGVTLIEILITVLVLSIGLLGVAALQSFALQSGQYADQQTQATNIAYELADFMRVDGRIRGAGAVPDLARWQAMAADTLPNGAVQVVFADPLLTVRVQWSDERFEDELETAAVGDPATDVVEFVTQI